jgi:integrase
MRGSIAKKGNNYYACLWINGKKKWFSGAGTSKRKAEAILNEKVADVQQGTYHEVAKIRFRDFAMLWLDSYAIHKVKGSTLRSYQDILKNHLVPALGEYLLTDITTALLQQYVSSRLKSAKSVAKSKKTAEEQQKSPIDEKPAGMIQPKTVINELVVVKEMFKHAMRWGHVKVNPAEYVERPRVESKEMEILSPDEVRRFLEQTPPRHRTLFLMAVLTGMRRGELLALRKKDIDWKNSQILVHDSVWKGRFVNPKSKTSIRRIDMSPYLARELQNHIEASPQSELDLVFSNSTGNLIDPDTMVKRKFLPALKRAGIRKIRFHDLRHTNVALRIEQGQNIKYIQNQLGHASIQTTLDRYGHLINDVNTEQAKKLDRVLGFDDAGTPLMHVVEKW